MTRETFALIEAEIRKEIPQLEEQAEFVRDAVQRAQKARSWAVRRHFIASAALGMATLYDVMERLWRKIAELIDGVVPTGERWHVELLHQMTLDIPGVRPALLRKETYRFLDELRRFRHFVRHAYVMDLIEEKLTAAYKAMEDGIHAFTKDAEAFSEALQNFAGSETSTTSKENGDPP